MNHLRVLLCALVAATACGRAPIPAASNPTSTEADDYALHKIVSYSASSAPWCGTNGNWVFTQKQSAGAVSYHLSVKDSVVTASDLPGLAPFWSSDMASCHFDIEFLGETSDVLFYMVVTSPTHMEGHFANPSQTQGVTDGIATAEYVGP